MPVTCFCPSRMKRIANFFCESAPIDTRQTDSGDVLNKRTPCFLFLIAVFALLVLEKSAFTYKLSTFKAGFVLFWLIV